MKRKERQNMIRFILAMDSVETSTLMMMTDADIEHLYNSIYEEAVSIGEQ